MTRIEFASKNVSRKAAALRRYEAVLAEATKNVKAAKAALDAAEKDLALERIVFKEAGNHGQADRGAF